MTTTFVVLVHDNDEDAWATKSDAEKQVTYDADMSFGKLLEERGGKIVGGQELAHSREGRVLTDGPYAETVEHLSGFYLVEAKSLDDVAEAARAMLPVHGRLEIRTAVTS